MDLLERMRRTDLDNWVHYDERELEHGELPWGRNYMARAVAEARLSTGDPCPWERGAGSGIPSTADRDFSRMMKEIERELQVEYDPHDFSVRITRRSECKQNQSLDTAKLDEFLDKM